jgi:site-specific DNA-methyltransferase (adenine-specific)
MINIYNQDCLKAIKEMSNNQFDLAIVDPPYGIGISGQKEVKKKRVQRNRSSAQNRKYHKEKKWDNDIPTKEYFIELQRVSINQIIWGANYFVKHINKGTKGWIIWDKQQKGLWSSDAEIAYSSYNKPTRIFLQNRIILQQEGGTIHPTQKPVKLYEWLLMNYAKEGDKILDTHLGSGSIAIACHNLGYDLEGYELDKDYYDNALKRIKEHQSQLRLI